MAYKPIRAYGIIGDTHSAALVGLDGSIDWACFPRFDSPSVFAALLDDQEGGFFRISPEAPSQSRQHYVGDTNILSTSFETEGGEVEVVDFMPITEDGRPGPMNCPHEIHRVVTGGRGRVRMLCRFEPRLNYGQTPTITTVMPHGALAAGEGGCIALSTEAPMREALGGVESAFFINAGQTVTFVASYGKTRPTRVRFLGTQAKLTRTRRYWEATAAKVSSTLHRGPWREQIIRSFLALSLMVYRPTGAIVAAVTTSLPEAIEGQRNWDYRYCWLRDAAFTLGVFYRMSDPREGNQFLRWLLHHCKVTMSQPKILYGVDVASDTREQELTHLSGYRGSKPVRIGNDAGDHFQLDVYGEVINSIATFRKYGGTVDHQTWSIVEAFANAICQRWKRKDRGIWEVRGPTRHFVYSKVMCWVGLTAAAGLAARLEFGSKADEERWRATAQVIKDEVLEKGWSEKLQSFVQYYGSSNLDASTLIMSMVGFLPGDDTRILSTIERIRERLSDGGVLVRRYDTARTNDGVGGTEGAFTLVSFWLIGALLYAGEVDEAEQLFQELLGYANHLGLLSEMVDPATGEALGNFPQAFSHIGLLHTARNLTVARLSEQGAIIVPVGASE